MEIRIILNEEEARNEYEVKVLVGKKSATCSKEYKPIKEYESNYEQNTNKENKEYEVPITIEKPNEEITIKHQEEIINSLPDEVKENILAQRKILEAENDVLLNPERFMQRLREGECDGTYRNSTEQ